MDITATHLTGLCDRCRRAFRWLACKGAPRVQSAVCLGCDGPLVRKRGRGCRYRVEEVDADWMTQNADTSAAECRPQGP